MAFDPYELLLYSLFSISGWVNMDTIFFRKKCLIYIHNRSNQTNFVYVMV